MSFRAGDDGSYHRTNWWPFLNESGETIPAGAILNLTGVSKEHGRNIITADKPDSAANFLLAVNSPLRVPDGKDGMLRPLGECLWMTYDTADGTPANEENWGADNGTFKLKKNFGGGGIAVIGADSENEIALVMVTGKVERWGKADANIAGAAEGTVSVYVGTGAPSSWTDSGDNVTARNITDVQGDSGNFLLLSYAGSQWNFLPLECPA